MAEEHRCQEGHRLCGNNCGFFGSPATNDLCSKCYRDLRLKEECASSAKIAVEKSLSSASSASPPLSVASSPCAAQPEPSDAVAAVSSAAPPAAAGGGAAQPPGRCGTCRKRVGMVGFRCRCGATYCGAHRYPDQHACSFDFRAAGKEAIARDNPVVKADKLGGRI